MQEKAENHYLLQLGNNQQWCFSADESARRFLEKLAWTMELRTNAVLGGQRQTRIGAGPSSGEATCLHGSDRPFLDKWNVRCTAGATLVSGDFSEKDTCNPGISFSDEAGYNWEFRIRHSEREPYDNMLIWQLLRVVYAAAERDGGLLLHGGIAARGDQGVLLLGPSGVGKSTCLGRMPSPWRALCDDETLVVKDAAGEYRIHPFPTWGAMDRDNGRGRWNVQEHVALGAVFLLQQCGPGEIDSAERHSAALASIYAFQNSDALWLRYQQEMIGSERNESRRRRFENACELFRAIPCYRLRTTRNGEFWTEIDRVL